MDAGDQREREIRAAQNQSLFRTVNERLQGLAEAFQFIAEQSANFTCECADTSCIAPISMTLAEYEAVRADPSEFAVLPGHVCPDLERVIVENERFVVVAKYGEAAGVARELDVRPRSQP